MTMEININCDLGEKSKHHSNKYDPDLLEIVNSANIACGFHAGDEETMHQTIQISKKHKCTVIKQRGLGYGDAIIKGVNHVETKYFIVFDADGSKDPIYIKDFYSKI